MQIYFYFFLISFLTVGCGRKSEPISEIEDKYPRIYPVLVPVETENKM
jgi:hypothetical protein